MSLSIERHQLPNKVTLLVDPIPSARSVSCAITCQGGARDERDIEAGITHLTEHLLFKRTRNRNTRQLSEVIDLLGGDINAVTDSESMSLVAHVPNASLDIAVELLGEMLTAPAFTVSDLEVEKDVIRQEILEAQDDPDEIVYEIFAERFWSGSSLIYPTFGSLATVAGLGQDEVRRRLTEMVVGDRIIVSAAGAVNPDQLLKRIEAIFGHLPVGQKPSDDFPDPEPGRYQQAFPVHQLHFCLGIPWPSLRDERYLRGVLCSSILGGSVSSRLFQLVREERGLAYDIHSAIDAYLNCGALLISGATEEKNCNEALSIILKELAKFKSLGVSQPELDRAREMVVSQLTMDCDSIGARMWRAIESELVHRRYVSADEVINRIRGISLDEANEFLASYLERPSAVLAIVGEIGNLQLSKQIELFCDESKLENLL